MLKHGARVIGWMLIIILVASMLAACGGSDGEKDENTESYTVGTLNFVPQLEQVVVGFKAGMAERGYVEGENITYIDKSVGSPDELGAAAQELIDAKVDLILATGTYEAQTVQALTTEIPVVFGVSSDPIGAGLVETVSHPGSNITGIMMPGGDQRRLQLLLEAVPTVTRIFVPYNPDDIGPARMVEAIQKVEGELGIELILREVHSPEDNEIALAEVPEDVDAIFVGPDDIVLGNLQVWLSFSLEHGLPLSVPMAALPTDMIFMGYGPDIMEMGTQATNLADQILKGTPAGDLPVESAQLFLTISLVAAEQLGFEVTDIALDHANHIIRADTAAR